MIVLIKCIVRGRHPPRGKDDMSGKTTCNTLKGIRKQIADANGIPFEVTECTYQGECSGTCPKCEAELKELDDALEAKRKRGEKVVIPEIEIPDSFCGMKAPSCEETPEAHEEGPRGEVPKRPDAEGPYDFMGINRPHSMSEDIPLLRRDPDDPNKMRPLDPKFMKPMRGDVPMIRPEPLKGQLKPPPEMPTRPDRDPVKPGGEEEPPLMGKIPEPRPDEGEDSPEMGEIPEPPPPFKPDEDEEPVLMGDVCAPSDEPDGENDPPKPVMPPLMGRVADPKLRSKSEPDEPVMMGEVPEPKKPPFFQRLFSLFRRKK